MSETLRSFPSKGGLKKNKRRFGPHQPAWFRNALILIVAGLIVHAIWVSRDTTPMHSVLPAQQKYGVFVSEVLPQRERLAASFVWDAIPETGETVRDILAQDPPVPPWILHNILGGLGYAAGNDLESFDDVLFVTRMSHIGALLERYSRLGPWTESDHAGGLRLRRFPGEDLHYAVRGRTLVVSPSRDRLIQALTLRPAEAMTPERFDATVEGSGVEDAGGVIHFDDGDAWGGVLRSASFALRLEPDQADLKGEFVLASEVSGEWDLVLSGLAPRPLPAPAEGMVQLSANFGKPLGVLLADVGTVLEWPALTEADWTAWPELEESLELLREAQDDDGEDGDDPAHPPVGLMLTKTLGALGPGFSLSVTDFDPHEIVPMPELTFRAESAGDLARAQFERFPREPEGASLAQSYGRETEDGAIVYLPAIGGPSIEPSFAVAARGMAAASNRQALRRVLAQNPNETPPPQGNLYLRIQPEPLTEAISETLRQICKIDALRGYTMESFENAAKDWITRARRVESATMLAGQNDAALVVEISLRGRPAQEQP